MDRGTKLFWLLVAALGGASAFFGASVIERQMQMDTAEVAGGPAAAGERSP